MRTPGGFGGVQRFNTGVVIAVLSPFGERRNGVEIMNDVRARLADLPGVFAFPVMRQGFRSSADKPVQFVIGAGTYEELPVIVLQDARSASASELQRSAVVPRW